MYPCCWRETPGGGPCRRFSVGWVVTLCSAGAHVLIGGGFSVHGILYQALLTAFPSAPGESRHAVLVWTFSTQNALVLLTGIVAGALIDRFSSRSIGIVGGFMVGLGHIISALSQSMPLFFVGYSVIAGIGFGLMQLPALVIVQQHFTTHRSLAVGIASAGAGLGSFLWPAVVRYFLEQFALHGTVLLMGGILLHAIPFAALYLPPRGKSLTSMNLEKASNSLFFGSTLSMPNLYQKKYETGECAFGSQPAFLSRKQYQDMMAVDRFQNYYKGHSQGCISGKCLQELESQSESVNKSQGCISAKCVHGKFECSQGKYSPLAPKKNQLSSVSSVVADDAGFKSDATVGNSEITSKDHEDYRAHDLTTQETAENKTAVDDSEVENVGLLKENNDNEVLNESERNENNKSMNHLANEDTVSHTGSYCTCSNEQTYHVGTSGQFNYLPKETHGTSALTLSSVTTNNNHKQHDLADCYTVKETCSNVRKISRTVVSSLGFSLLNSWTMWLLLVGFFFQTLGMLTPLFFLPVRLYESSTLGASSVALLISIIGATDTTGRLMFGALGTALGNTPLRPVVMFAVLSALAGTSSIVSTILPTTLPALAVYTALYGLFLGGMTCNQSMVVVDQMGIENLPKAYGLFLLFGGVGFLLSSPLLVAICDATGSYNMAFYVGGAFQLLNTLCYLLIVILGRGKTVA